MMTMAQKREALRLKTGRMYLKTTTKTGVVRYYQLVNGYKFIVSYAAVQKNIRFGIPTVIQEVFN